MMRVSMFGRMVAGSAGIGIALHQLQSETQDTMKVLREQFGLADFRPGQRSIIEAVLKNESALAVFPTGGGKSLCYQLPAVLFPQRHLTIVISPLIALMKDQVDSLRRRGIAADMIGSSQTQEERAETRRLIANFSTRILFIAPEQISNEVTRALICSQTIGLLAIDEAHCISEWGHAFRPDYLRLARFAKDCKAARVLCLTATATPLVAEDICTAFSIKPVNSIRTSFHRHNLRLSYRHVSSEDRDSAVAEYLIQQSGVSNGPTIVYATTQETTERFAAFLCAKGLTARFYHAGMETTLRTEVQDWFMSSDSAIVVATIAFGMGIDKSNIRRVVHYNLPKSLEGYAQEIGRAGRDGQPAECRLYFCPDDIDTLENFIRAESPSARSIHKVLRDFYCANGDGSFGVSINQRRELAQGRLANDCDLPENVVRMLLGFVDIYHGLIEMLTPKYNSYKLQSASGEPVSALRDRIIQVVQPEPIAQALASMLVTKRTWAFLELDAPHDQNITREQLAEGIHQIHCSPLFKLIATGVHQVFKINSLPSSLEQLARTEAKRFQERERREMSRLRQVVDLITTDTKCQSGTLMRHFGDVPEKGWECSCEGCMATTAGMDNKLKNAPLIAVNSKKTSGIPPSLWVALSDAVMSGAIPSDDPRLVARVAIGAKPPRIRKLQLTQLPVFGSLQLCDFEQVLASCEQLCGSRDSDI